MLSYFAHFDVLRSCSDSSSVCLPSSWYHLLHTRPLVFSEGSENSRNPAEAPLLMLAIPSRISTPPAFPFIWILLTPTDLPPRAGVNAQRGISLLTRRHILWGLPGFYWDECSFEVSTRKLLLMVFNITFVWNVAVVIIRFHIFSYYMR